MPSLQLLLTAAFYFPVAASVLSISDYNRSFVGEPDVFVIGVMKAGTTSLSDFLTKRLGYVSSFGEKEPKFFEAQNFNDENFEKYVRGFREEQRVRGEQLVTFDASPTYFTQTDVFVRMRNLYSPECFRKKKFVLSLREPVVASYSWYIHAYGECMKADNPFCYMPGGPGFHDTYHDKLKRSFRWTVMESAYVDALSRFLQIIPRDQLFILNFESLIGERQQDTLNRLLYFLGKPGMYSKSDLLPHSNSKESHCNGACDEHFLHEVLCSDIRMLNETVYPLNIGLEDLINSDPDKPVSEPTFNAFTEKFHVPCTEDTSMAA